MKNWSIRKLLLLLALLPVMLTAISLSLYFTVAQLRQISDNLHEHARSTLSQIASISEYALYSGNTPELQRSLQPVLGDRDIVNITIRDKHGKILLDLSDAPDERDNSLLDRLLENRHLVFQHPVFTVHDSLSDYSDNIDTRRDSTPQLLGSISLTIDSYHSDRKKTETVIQGALIALVILALSIFIALLIGRRIARPVQDLTRAVTRVAAGDLDTKLELDAPAELGELEDCVNRMIEELRIARSDMESRITEFTRELQETLLELEERNAQLDIARSNALQASKAKSEFLANMSHEIRTPLSGIIGFAELLEKTALDAQQQEYAHTITESSRNLLTIIEEILDLSKIESGKLDIDNRDCDLVAIVENIITLLTPGAQAKSIELFYELNPSTPSVIVSDSLRVQQILTNLIGNAVKFTERGYVYVNIETSPFDPAFIRIVVADTGIGLNEDDKANVFKAFSQADVSISRRFGGTGLGLVISRKLTQLLGGEIGFDSTPGEGSTFWFTLPAVVASADATTAVQPLPHVVALVDENYLTRKACASMLRRWGCQVEEYSHDRLRDQHTLSQSADACVLSLSLEDMQHQPEQLVETIRAHSTLPLMVICSSLNEARIAALRRAGADAVLPRSSHRDKLHRTLARLLGLAPAEAPPADTRIESIAPRQREPAVLIVDDNATNLKLARIILGKSTSDILTASSGQEALDMVRQKRFDIIFMDLHMPEMDGYQCAQHIRALGDRIEQPCMVALTASAMPQEIRRAEESGMDRVLIKPISEQQVAQLLSQAPQLHATGNQARSSEEAQAYSVTEAINMTSGNTRLAREMLDMLLRELPDTRKAIDQALQQRDKAALKQQVHSLHGATQYCATPALRAAVAAFEAAIDGGREDSFQQHQQALQREIERLLALNPDTLLAPSSASPGAQSH